MIMCAWDLSTGKARGRYATYTRQKNPKRFWFHVIFTGGFGLFIVYEHFAG